MFRWIEEDDWRNQACLLKKSSFLANRQNLGDVKCPENRESRL